MAQSIRRYLGLVRWGLIAICALSFLLLFHNYVCPLPLPYGHVTLAPSQIQPETPGSGGPSHAFTVLFAMSGGNQPHDTRSQALLFEDGDPMMTDNTDIEMIRTYGHGYYNHEDGRVVFSALDNSDPRTNGHAYEIYYPRLHSPAVGYSAAILMGLAAAGLYLLGRASPRREQAPGSGSCRFNLHLAASAATLLIALYCSTGTLSPYANTTSPLVIAPCNYLYNVDHPHFRVLFDFIDGKPRSVWDGAIFMRRILFPALCYPFMKAWGFAIGGTIGGIALNVSGFVAFLLLLRRQVGAKGAALAGWLLALYPGAAYWGGLPYVYSFIFPGSLLLSSALFALHRANRLRWVALLSLLMGVAYLGYDLGAFFLPASLLVLLGRRKPVLAAVAAACQAAPMASWLWFLRHMLGQSLVNSNSNAPGIILASYFHPADHAAWWRLARSAPDIGLNVFFGANFFFLPALFIILLVINAVTSRVRLHPAELALLASALILFLFNNLAPEYVGCWQMRGTWIARLYQPMFPAFILFAARWFQALPRLRWPAKLGVGAVLLGASAGNFLITFGPILDDPLQLSGTAFWRFYDHNPDHGVYEGVLERFGRRPLGFCAEGK